jgi:hypothetical protein
VLCDDDRLTGGSSSSVTSGDWPARRAASRRTAVACRAGLQADSPSASSRSGTKMAVASANPGTATSVTSRAVRMRSRVLPIRAAASLSPRLVRQLALARLGQQHVTHVMPGHRAGCQAEQFRGGRRPARHAPTGIQRERSQVSSARPARA